jgi:hypothetical protein
MSADSLVTLLERWAATLHDFAHSLTDIALLETALLDDPCLPVDEIKSGDELCVAVDDDVGVVRDDDDLPPLLVLSELLDDQVVDQGVVEVVLGLVEDDRLVTVREQEGEDRSSLLTRRALLDGKEPDPSTLRL